MKKEEDLVWEEDMRVMSAEINIQSILEHINNVQRNCDKLGLKLIKLGQVNMGRKLIANGRIHDNSKFHGIEFEHLFYRSHILKDVISHHQSVNPHHPEYWWDGKVHGKGIYQMPDVYFAEMVCDCVARSQEFGTDVRVWFFTKAKEKYGFDDCDEVAKKVNYYLDLLLEKPFDLTGK
mgnify:CR=1 FL=1